MPNADLADVFLDAVKAAGWYKRFEQTNTRGELTSVDGAINAHLATQGQAG
jgi:hypothetical protein